ncbi:MAG: nickel-dependent lactate racemase [Candidatus Caldatribacteriota bacterium]
MSYILFINNDSYIYEDSKEKVSIKIAKNNFAGLITITEPGRINYPEDILYSLKNPINSLPLNQLAQGAKRVVIIIPDVTRGVPLSGVFPYIIEELNKAGVELDQITVVIALGVHRNLTQEEIVDMIGKEFSKKINVINHDPFDKNKLVHLGETKYGTPIEINKVVFNSDFKITIGKVEPHEFAGFSGGRKVILPGICSERSIKFNHRPEMIMDKNSRPGSLEKNIVNLDMIEAAKLLKIDFSINFVLNSKNEIISMFSGDIFATHQKSVDFLKSYCEVKINEVPDIIITTPGYPLNIDFYQSIKPLIALEPICKKDNVIILYSSCPEGINSPDMLLAFKNSSNVEEVTNYLKKNYEIQMDHALLLSRILSKGIRLIAYSPNIQPNLLETMHFKPANNVQEALNIAYSMFNKNKSDIKVLFFPQAQRTLPVLGK